MSGRDPGGSGSDHRSGGRVGDGGNRTRGRRTGAAGIAASANPYSAGFYPLGRKYTVGDEATFRESDLLTGVEQRIFTLRVTGSISEADRVEINGGRDIWDLMGNPIKAGNSEFDVPQQFSPAELQVGRKWTAAFKGTEEGSR